MKVRGLNFIFTWATFLIMFEPYHDTTESCFHENQDSMMNMSAVDQWPVNNEDSRRLKQLTRDTYGPIRITLIYSLGQYLSDDEQAALKRVLERAVRKITSLLSGTNFVILMPGIIINSSLCVNMMAYVLAL